MSTREYSTTRIQKCSVRIPHSAVSIRLASTPRNPLPFSPLVPATRLPEWPDDRFDMIWSFILQTAASPASYAFSQIPQRLLAGDVEAVG
jgi:hypothetical protein